jgi:hypothetical protein
MKRLTLALAAAAGLAVAAPLAALAADVAPGAIVGTDDGAIRTALTAEGYDVRKVESEDGQIEVYAVKDGKRLEIYVDGKTGAVTRVKEES